MGQATWKKYPVFFIVSLVQALIFFPLAASASDSGFDFAGMNLPPGFTATTYVSGVGFDPHKQDPAPGLPAIVTITFDSVGAMYFARTANRLTEIFGLDTAPIYRVPPGSATIRSNQEHEIIFGPPIPDPDEAEVNSYGEVFVSSSNRREGYGSLYKLTPSGQAVLFAGGKPVPGTSPLFKDPEGIAFDPAGNVYVTDYDLGVVIKLDRQGKVLDPRFVSGIGRGRTLTYDPRGYLWLASDGPHDSPAVDGSGLIYQISLPEGRLRLVHSGPLASGMSLSPAGFMFAAQRRSGKIFALTPAGKRVDFATFTVQAAVRTLGFPPINQETQKIGIAGDLFVMVFPMLDYPVREIIRISGPFDAYVKQAIRSQ